jgi:hypothetical protein
MNYQLASSTNVLAKDAFPGLERFHQILSTPPPMARRSFRRSLGLGATLLTSAAGLVTGSRRAAAPSVRRSVPATDDVDVMRFLAAIELIEADLWQQYAELAAGNDNFIEAIKLIDDHFPQYIRDNTDDEVSHATFLNAYIASMGGEPVNLDAFRTRPSSRATGAKQVGRLTNLFDLTVDTSWWIRYRSPVNPQVGTAFPQLIQILERPGIPTYDLPLGARLQSIANTAVFHFAMIEQVGSSLYDSMATKVSDETVLRVVTSIGGAEVFHFAIWHDGARNVVPVSYDGLVFPDIDKAFRGDSLREKNLVMPNPCEFIDPSLPPCSVIRPMPPLAPARAATMALVNSGLFKGQSRRFFETLNELAQAADKAARRC